ncbi:hypothetical protein TNIN_350501 [Trichonephila inaurata madagascariensis]|uniref:Uncharacterized protein n=1 Tax=Trichonephila inaurata madagascariensis TaxID=2747483 RepID=A0A8X6YL54_9ARAC|nr:hypothetical protein TNIN_350501 [Trichonephila inaurata madagascariensis]
MDHNPLKAKTVGGQFNGISCNIGPKGRNLGTREVPDVTPADTTGRESRATNLQRFCNRKKGLVDVDSSEKRFQYLRRIGYGEDWVGG